MSSNPKPSPSVRSITEIISPYRNSFRDIDFRRVLAALISRDEFLKRDFNLQSMHWQRHQRRLRREISAIKGHGEKGKRVLELEKDELCTELEILNSFSIESDDRVEGLVRVLGEKDDEICRLMEKLGDVSGEIGKIRVVLGEFEGLVQKVEVLEEEKREVEVKLDVFRTENDCLVADKVKFDEELRKLELLSVGVKDEIEGLRWVLGEKNEEILRNNERIEELVRRIEELEKERRENEVRFDVIRRENESLIAKMAKLDEESKSVRKEMDGKLKEMKEKNDAEIENLGRENEDKVQLLKKMIKTLEIEKSEIAVELKVFQRENESLVVARESVVEQLGKLEKEKTENEIKVEKLRRDNEYLKALKANSEEEMESLRKFSSEMDVAMKEMRKKSDAEIESLGKEKEVEIEQLKKKIEGLEMEKSEVMEEKEELARKYEKMEQQVVKLEEDVARLLRVNKISGFVTEVRRETKRRRMLSQWLNQKNRSDGTSDKTLNPCCKVKKAVDLSLVDLVHQARTAASGSRSDKKFVTPPKQVVTCVRQYNKFSVKVEEPPSNRMVGGQNSQRNALITQADASCSPQAQELIAACRRNKRLVFHQYDLDFAGGKVDWQR